MQLQKTRSLGLQASVQIREALLRGEYQPGQALAETSLAESLAMSRTPIRQALQELARDGFVEFIPHRGYFVPRLSLDDIRELFELRESLEGYATRCAALRITKTETERLEELYQLYERAEAVEDWVELGTEFHNMIISLSANARMVAILDSLKAQISMTRHTVLRNVDERRNGALQEHRAILDAIKQRDADNAELQARVHVRRSYEAMLQGSYLEQR